MRNTLKISIQIFAMHLGKAVITFYGHGYFNFLFKMTSFLSFSNHFTLILAFALCNFTSSAAILISRFVLQDRKGYIQKKHQTLVVQNLANAISSCL